jgi:hypothetical protein
VRLLGGLLEAEGEREGPGQLRECRELPAHRRRGRGRRPRHRRGCQRRTLARLVAAVVGGDRGVPWYGVCGGAGGRGVSLVCGCGRGCGCAAACTCT